MPTSRRESAQGTPLMVQPGAFGKAGENYPTDLPALCQQSALLGGARSAPIPLASSGGAIQADVGAGSSAVKIGDVTAETTDGRSLYSDGYEENHRIALKPTVEQELLFGQNAVYAAIPNLP